MEDIHRVLRAEPAEEEPMFLSLILRRAILALPLAEVFNAWVKRLQGSRAPQNFSTSVRCLKALQTKREKQKSYRKPRPDTCILSLSEHFRGLESKIALLAQRIPSQALL